MRGFARPGCIRANDPVDALHHFSRVPRPDDTRPCSFLDCTVTRMGNSANDSEEHSSEIAAEQVTLVLDTLGSLILSSTCDKRAIEKLG